MKEASLGYPGEGSIRTYVVSREKLVPIGFLTVGISVKEIGDSLLNSS